MTKKIVFIGAAGEMCRVAIERFANTRGDWELVLCDIRPDTLQALVQKLPTGRATTRQLDLFDRDSLRGVVDGAALVVLGAGPYIRTSGPVVEACLEAEVPYLDFDDDVESTEAALALDDRARQAGVPILVGCGASPGMSNVMAVDAANELDTVETIDVCWVTGDERPAPYGRAVLEHALHISAGQCKTWANGGPAVHEAFAETEIMPMGGGLGEHRLYETAHPEAVTLPRRYPQADRIRVLGGLDPVPMNGILRGVALAVQRGKMTLDEAVDFLDNIMTDGLGNLKGWRHAIAGILGQLLRREISVRTYLRFIAYGILRRHFPYHESLMVRVTGTRNGKPAVAIRRNPISGPDTFMWNDMGAITGASCAAFMILALESQATSGGVMCPEDWVQPQAFYAALERIGTPRAEIIETPTAPGSMARQHTTAPKLTASAGSR